MAQLLPEDDRRYVNMGYLKEQKKELMRNAA